MLTKVFLFLVNLVRSWMLRRAERKATRIATEWLRRSPDRVLDDIGISRIALFTDAEIRAVAESMSTFYEKAPGGDEGGQFPSRQLQIIPFADVQMGLQSTPVEPSSLPILSLGRANSVWRRRHPRSSPSVAGRDY
jgi:hypothetical protein